MADKDVLYHEVLEALQAGGCALCRLAYRASDSYLNAVLYEGVTDVKVRETLRDARGVCYRHAWRLAGKRGAVLGTAIVYRDVINTLTKALEAGQDDAPRLFGFGPAGRSSPDLARNLAASKACPACTLEQDSEQRTAKILLKHLNDAAIEEAYIAAGGLCLPHFQVALANANAGAGKKLAGWQAAAWRSLRDELDELIRKHDYRFRSETITEAEAQSWQRAVAAAIGEPERQQNQD
jgi:hypothetical protein